MAAAILAIAAIAATSLLRDGRDLSPPAGRQSPSSAASVTERAPTGSTGASGSAGTVEGTFGRLLGTIEAGLGSTEGASKLRDHAFHLFDAVQEGKLEDVSKEAEHLLDELDKLVEDGEVSTTSADSIRAAVQDFLTAAGVNGANDEDGEDEGHQGPGGGEGEG